MKIAVVGAGPTGCAAALSLAQAGFQVSLISDGRHGVGEHMPAACAPLLLQLGIPTRDLVACSGIVAGEWHWDALSHPLGGGWLLDRARFGESLRQAVRQRGIALLEPTRLVGLEPGWRLQLDQGEVRCDFLVDASGRRGVVARRLGIVRHRYTCQRALVGWLSGASEPDASLCVEELGENWAYTCRVAEGRRVAALLGPGELDWEQLQRGQLLAPRLRGYTLQAPPRIVPADASLLEEVSGPGWLALGDAAASTDPMVGQGLFAALRAGLSAPRLVGASAEVLRDHRDQLRERFHQLLLALSQPEIKLLLKK